MVINTYGHWDYIGGNHEFNKVHIHEFESKLISKPLNLSFLMDSLKDIVNRYNNFSFSIPPAPVIKPLREEDIFDLGGIEVRIFLTPGHSDGSISILTNKGELFTGDTAHFGAVFLPKKKKLPIIISSLLKLTELQNNYKINAIYPSHKYFPADPTLLRDLYNGISHF